MKKFLCLIINVVLIASLMGCTNTGKTNIKVPTKKVDGKVSVVSLDIMTTNKFLYNVIKDISGNRHNVQFMFKNDVDVKQFEYTTDSINNVSKYNIFMYLGADFEPWASDFIGKLDKNSVATVDMSRGTKILDLDNKVQYGNISVTKNSYYWTDLSNYKTMLVNIKNSLEEKDAKSRDFYEKNFATYIKKVNDCEKDFKAINDKLKEYTFVTEDSSFDYFFSYAGLDSVKVSADDLTKPDTSKNLQDKLKDKKKICYIYSDDKNPQMYNGAIQKYNMKTLKFITYDENSDYINTIKENMKAMKELIK
ncbi:metal ABC transporter substrate-binding protein [Clostridium felsineum]|uniref:metal ABC transporter substrate-binding protein n=1 Tax=Clostridium felsineum TaxID=36839 RepID=UPI00214D53A2|nr:metal ABC transporter substrate-binding protein [Clostridium felsineum]MCR3758417.1 metal ABC transporter substrate-binding protein [Clostridium felsineum]